MTDLTLARWEEDVCRAPTRVAVLFEGETCEACRLFAPVVAVAEEKRPAIRFFRVRAERDGLLCAMVGVLAVPALVVVEKDEIVARASGALSEEEVLALLDATTS